MTDRLPAIVNTTERLAHTLLRRGFLVGYQKDRIKVHRGVHEDDLRSLEKLCGKWDLELRRSSNDPAFMAVMDVPAGLTDFEKSIIYLPSCRGMSAVYGFYHKPTWEAFVNNRYGAKVPSKELDLGVALLIKTLPLAGVRTKMCCDRHGGRPPYIEFCGQHHKNWFMQVIQQCRQELPILDGLQFNLDSESESVSIQLNNQADWQPTDTIPVFDTLFQLATSLMSEDKIQQFKEAKAKYVTYQECSNPCLY